jgi:hypothetical protein
MLKAEAPRTVRQRAAVRQSMATTRFKNRAKETAVSCSMWRRLSASGSFAVAPGFLPRVLYLKSGTIFFPSHFFSFCTNQVCFIFESLGLNLY